MTQSEPRRRGNPYDYIHAVSNPLLFAGRKHELAEIEQEIGRLRDEPSIAPMITLVGERRVGKTSLLFQIGEMCNREGLLPINVALSDVNAEEAWEFWREVLDELVNSCISRGLLDASGQDSTFGFHSSAREDPRPNPVPTLTFTIIYGNRASLGLKVPPVWALQKDVELLFGYVESAGYRGAILFIDEAHLLLKSRQILQQLRQLTQAVGKFGVVFSGEPPLGRLFNDPAEPLYAQARIFPIRNFLSMEDITECALLPLTTEEQALMSPMTVEYLAKLSGGKPNQVRLICNAIYKRYERGQQDDLNITIQTLDDVLDSIRAGFSTSDGLTGKVNSIRRLNSVDLEILYMMTRYPNWSVEDLIDLDESFRGDKRSPMADARRRRIIESKKSQFIEIGLMEDNQDTCTLSGDEFLHLYLRFWYEVQKFGELSRGIHIGKGAPTAFGEKCEKMLHSLCWEIKHYPDMSFYTWEESSLRTLDRFVHARDRFAFLQKLRTNPHGRADQREYFAECLEISEFVKERGAHIIFVITLRNLESPREVMHAELYFNAAKNHSGDISIDSIKSLSQQAKEARVAVDAFGALEADLPDLNGFLELVHGPTLDEIRESAPLVIAWQFASVQRLLKRQAPAARRDEKDDDEGSKWILLYEKGKVEEALESINEALLAAEDTRTLARLHNDRGYILSGKSEYDAAQQDLERALDFHFGTLALPLLNLSVIDIDKGNYDQAVQRINEALFLTGSRQETSASFLRLRVPKTVHLVATREKFEQHPANVLEAAYVNLIYALLQSSGVKSAIEVAEEALELLPESPRLKHTLARVYWSNHQVGIADRIYKELSELTISDDSLRQEVDLYFRTSRAGRPPVIRRRR